MSSSETKQQKYISPKPCQHKNIVSTLLEDNEETKTAEVQASLKRGRPIIGNFKVQINHNY